MTLHIQTIFIEEKTAFAATMYNWLVESGFNVVPFDNSQEQGEKIDAVVLFHENHNFDKRVSELRDNFDRLQVASHKIDLSGTMNVALSHLSLFFDRTKCKNVLFLGSDNLKNHPKLAVFQEKWNL
jgi:hypothetical protein